MSTFTPLPLTTVFTPPSTCTSLTDAGTPGHYFHEFNPSVTSGAWTSCYPPGFTHAWSSSHITEMYFSPGVCPNGFTMCNSDCIAAYVGFWGLASTSETGGRCCLSNWLVVPYQRYCITTTSGTTVTALGVEIRWKASDLLLYDPNTPGMAEQASTTAVPTLTVISTANPSSPGVAEQASTTAAPTKTFITAATITISQAGESDTHKLGTAAEIGIGVGGATLVLICFASLIAFLFLRKRRTLDTKPGLANDSANSAPELAYNWARGAYNEPIELMAKPKAKFRTCEIDSNPLLEAYNGPIELRAKSKQTSRKFEITSNQLSELR